MQVINMTNKYTVQAINNGINRQGNPSLLQHINMATNRPGHRTINKGCNQSGNADGNLYISRYTIDATGTDCRMQTGQQAFIAIHR